MQVARSCWQWAGCGWELRGIPGGAWLWGGSMEREHLVVGAVTPFTVNHTQGHTPQQLQSHPFKGDQQFLLWTSFRASVNAENFLFILLNKLQKQKMSQDPLGFLLACWLVGFLSTDTGWYSCGYGVIAWISFILSVTCKVVSCWLVSWSHTVRIKVEKKRCST